jgi:ribosomal protein S17
MKIEKKIWPEYFDKIVSGEKKFEVRLNDFEVEPGDTLQLREWDPDKKEYTGRQIEKTVTSVIKTNDLTFWPVEEIEKYGLQIISLA